MLRRDVVCLRYISEVIYFNAEFFVQSVEEFALSNEVR